MASAALMIANMVDAATIGASSQEQEMPVGNLLTPHIEEHWRSTSNRDFFVIDKQDVSPADTFVVCGLTNPDELRPNLELRLRLSASDSTGAMGELLDTGTLASGSRYLDVEYGQFVYPSASALAWRYARVDLYDPDADYVEAGLPVAGLRESFTYNFVPGAGITTIDRSRIGKVAGGQTLTWPDNKFRRLEFNLEWVTAAQRYGVLERMNRANGNHKPVLLILDTDSDNLARDTIWGLVTDATPDTYGVVADLFSRQLRIDERL